MASRFDLPGLTAFLGPLLAAREPRSIELPVYDRARRTMYDRRVQVTIAPDDLIIVEGVPALLAGDLAALAHVRIHVEAPEAQRVAHLRADYAWRGERDAGVDALLASRAADETGPIERAAASADFVIRAWAAA